MFYWWLLFLLLKLGLVSLVPLTSDENYYWVWAQNLCLSYFDHPPFVAWLFKLGSWLPDSMLKWPAVLLGHLSLLIWGRLLSNIGFDNEQIYKWFLLVVLAPLVGLSSMVLTPDLPLLFFYSISIYAFERALTIKKLKYYLLFGLGLGLGFTSKYLILLIIPCLCIYLLVSGQYRNLSWKNLIGLLLFAILGALPVILWNYQNDWKSFRFQIDHGVGKRDWKPMWTVEYIASVLMFILPQYWFTFFKSFFISKQKLLISLSIPIILFFLFTSFRSKVEANWSQLAFLPIISLLAYCDRSRWRTLLTVFIWSGLLSTLIIYWNKPWFPSCPDKMCEPKRYFKVIDISNNYKPFMASNYQMASYLWFQKKSPVYKLYDMSRTDFFDTLPESKPNIKEFYLAKHLITEFPSWLIKENYKTELVLHIDEDLDLIRVYR